jgi:hypothetical protein
MVPFAAARAALQFSKNLIKIQLVFWLFRTTKIIFYLCLLTHFARQDRQNGNLKNKQNHATKVTKIRKKRSYENDMSQT